MSVEISREGRARQLILLLELILSFFDEYGMSEDALWREKLLNEIGPII